MRMSMSFPFIQYLFLHTAFKCFFITNVNRVKYGSGISCRLLTGHSINVTEGYLMSSLQRCFYYCSPYAFHSPVTNTLFFRLSGFETISPATSVFDLTAGSRFLFPYFCACFQAAFLQPRITLLLSFYIIICHEFFIFKSEEQKYYIYSKRQN